MVQHVTLPRDRRKDNWVSRKTDGTESDLCPSDRSRRLGASAQVVPQGYEPPGRTTAAAGVGAPAAAQRPPVRHQSLIWIERARAVSAFGISSLSTPSL